VAILTGGNIDLARLAGLLAPAISSEAATA
jgi:hypothetical protein